MQALALGDETGSGQGSMADLLLITKADPERAIEMADQGMQLSTGRSSRDLYFGGEVANDLRRARCWARTARGLSQLNRKSEARQAIDRALRLTQAAEAEAATVRADTSVLAKLILGKRVRNGRDLALATAHWKIGLALLSAGEPSEAAEHFRRVRATDKRGKYRRLAQQALDALDRGATPEVGHA
jgi:tetratricopeptide (TPR) repeat protein